MPEDPRGDPLAHFDSSNGHRICAHLRDGRVIALGRHTGVQGAGAAAVVVRIPDLKYIETILNVQFETNPDTCVYEAIDKKIVGNLVGMTICGIQAGTTLTVEVVAIGPP